MSNISTKASLELEEEVQWERVILSNICSIISGKNQKEVETKSGQYPIYGSGGEIGRSREYICEPGTTIIGRKGTINSPIFINTRFWNVDTAFGLAPLAPINKWFCFYFFQSFDFTRLDKSTTIPNLAKRDIAQIEFALPPLPEQRSIVSKIEQLFSELDNAIANLKQAQDQLKIYRQTVLKKAFEGELTREWREHQSNLPSTKELLEQIEEERERNYNKQLKEWKEAVDAWEAGRKEGKKPKEPSLLLDINSLEKDNEGSNMDD